MLTSLVPDQGMLDPNCAKWEMFFITEINEPRWSVSLFFCIFTFSPQSIVEMIHFDEYFSDWVGNPPPNNLDNRFPLVGASFFAVKSPADGLRYQLFL